MSEKIVQTAGRDQLGEFAPMFAHLNDDVLFGEVWNEEAIDVKTKCIITVVSLMASGVTDSSLTYHLQNAKANGVTEDENAAIIKHRLYIGRIILVKLVTARLFLPFVNKLQPVIEQIYLSRFIRMICGK